MISFALATAFATCAHSADVGGWKFLVEFPPDKRVGCAKPPCLHGAFFGGKMTREQCEAARNLALTRFPAKEGYITGRCIPRSQDVPGEVYFR
jgi:hypothetical protein